MMQIIKYNNIFLLLMLACGSFVSCTNVDEVPEENDNNGSRLTCVAKSKEFVDLSSPSSRSSLSFGSKGMVFSWTEGDAMTVFAKDDHRATQLYRLQGEAGSTLAHFNAENFKMKEGQLYYAFSKVETATHSHVVIPDQNNINVDYSGQTQIGNANTAHLGDYDFMAAATLCENPDEAHFSFTHLGATLRIVMSFNPETITDVDEKAALAATSDGTAKMMRFTSIQLYDSENSFRQQQREFSFATGTDGLEYTLKWPTQVIEKMDRFELTLKKEESSEDGVTRFDPFNDGGSNTSGQKDYGKLISYIEVPPVDFRNKTIGVMLKGYYEKSGTKHEVSYVGTYTGMEVKNDKAYQLSLSMRKPDENKVTLKVNHMWQHGSTLDDTKPGSKAGTGDPGYDKEIVTPTYIYYIYCHDGKVIKPTTAQDAQAVTSISGLNSVNWDTQKKDGIYVSTYKGNGSGDNGIITLQKPAHVSTEPAHQGECTYHLYVVASTSPLTITADVNDSESSIQNKLYNLPTSGDVQIFMRDLYSTPWDATSFTGNLIYPMQDVILYHVAAKVDLKWNSTTAVETIYADNVKNNNLLLFQPTQNLDGVLSSGGYSDSWAMPVDQQFNGRYILYLPQFKTEENNNCSYKIGLGATATTPITFTPISTQGGFTSWLRWLKKQ